MRILVMLNKNHQPISLTKNEKDQLQKTIGSIIATFPTHCAMYDSHSTLLMGKRPIPRSWVRSILPYLRLPKEIDPFIEDGMLMVDLSTSPNFDDVYQRLVVMMTQQLRAMYHGGTVICSASFAEKWGLSPFIVPRLPLPDLTVSLEEWSDCSASICPKYGTERLGTMSQEEIGGQIITGPHQQLPFTGTIIGNNVGNNVGSPQLNQPSKPRNSGSYSPSHPNQGTVNTLTTTTAAQMVSTGSSNDQADDPNQETIDIYQATWNDPRIIRHRTQFLLDRLHGLRWCRFHLKTIHTAEEEQATWHRIVDELRQIGFPLEGIVFTGCGILLDVSVIHDINQLRQIGAIFHYGWMKSGGPVRTIPVQHLEEATQVQQQILEQHPELSSSRVVIYRTGDRLRPYSVSYKDLDLESYVSASG